MVTEPDLVTLKMEAVHSSGLSEQTFISLYEKMAITRTFQVNFTNTHEIFIVCYIKIVVSFSCTFIVVVKFGLTNTKFFNMSLYNSNKRYQEKIVE